MNAETVEPRVGTGEALGEAGGGAPETVRVQPAQAIAIAAEHVARQDWSQARLVCQQILVARPDVADAYNVLSVVEQACGNLGAAIDHLKRAIGCAPNQPSYHANLGEMLRRAGRIDEADKILRDALALDDTHAQALNNLGILHFDRGDYEMACYLYRRALAERPHMAEALNNLGNALRMVGEDEAACAAYGDALTQQEIYPEAYNNLGTLLQRQGRLEEGERALRKAIAQRPGYVDARNNLARLLIARGEEVEALRVLSDTLKVAPTNVDTLMITASLQLRRNHLVAAERGARAVLGLDPENVEALVLLGQLLHDTDRFAEALAALSRAVELSPDNPDALNHYGVALKSVGRLDEAREQILRSLAINPQIFGAYANLNDLVDFSDGVGDELFGQMEALFDAANDREAPALLPLHFAFAKALDDRGEHARALEHYVAGGRMKRAMLDYDERAAFAFFDDIRAAYPREAIVPCERAADGEHLVFIVGMPRSGSTLVEQILASHPDVHGAGEVKHLARGLGHLRDRFPSLHAFPQMAGQLTDGQLDLLSRHYLDALGREASGARRVTDKLLTNYFFVGLLHTLFPKARFIHTLRNPVDTCLSGFTKLFKDDMPHSYDLGEIGRYYGKYRELMDHWLDVLPVGTIHEVRYEDVVADTEGQARALVDFLGLEWDPACLDFHQSCRPVRTASVAQVRRPIYTSAVERWKRYGDGLQPLIDALA